MTTLPRPRNIDEIRDAPLLLEGRYGTREQCDIWGTDANTYKVIMEAQVAGLETINSLHPGRIPQNYLRALAKTANLEYVKPERVRELEAKGEHDVIAVNAAWGEAADAAEKGASSVINFIRTSADSTETAKALRCKQSIEVLADSVENLRDIMLEKSVEWTDPYMDQTHLYDALPTVAGRPLSFYAEMLQSDLDFLAFVYGFSLVGKWADATGNHHAAVAAGINGMELQQAYAESLGLRHMTAPSQIPGREFIADIMYSLGRTAGTLANTGRYFRTGRGHDRGTLVYKPKNPKKGSSAMPHKDAFGGNPTTEEQSECLLHVMEGKVATALGTIVFDYGRDLTGSASDRLDIGPAFKFTDHVTRNLANIVYRTSLVRGRSLDRMNRTYGVVTAARVMTHLVDPAKTDAPMPREQAHDLTARLATRAYRERRLFSDVLSEDEEVASRLDRDTILELTDPTTYIGQSLEIIEKNFNDLHGKKTFAKSLQI